MFQRFDGAAPTFVAHAALEGLPVGIVRGSMVKVAVSSPESSTAGLALVRRLSRVVPKVDPQVI